MQYIGDPFLQLKMSKIVQKGVHEETGLCKALVQKRSLIDFRYNSLISD